MATEDSLYSSLKYSNLTRCFLNKYGLQHSRQEYFVFQEKHKYMYLDVCVSILLNRNSTIGCIVYI